MTRTHVLSPGLSRATVAGTAPALTEAANSEGCELTSLSTVAAERAAGPPPFSATTSRGMLDAIEDSNLASRQKNSMMSPAASPTAVAAKLAPGRYPRSMDAISGLTIALNASLSPNPRLFDADTRP